MRRPIGVLLLPTAGVALVLAACGSSAGTASRTGATTTRTSATTTTVPAPASSGGSTTPTPAAPRATAALAPGGCGAGQISVSVGASSAGLGHLGQALRFQNVGSTACSLRGYPGVALVRSGGRRLNAARTPNGYLGGLSTSARSDPVIRLRPHQSGSALLEGEDSTAGGRACPRYAALLVTPPNQTVTARMARPLSICDPQIHPVVGGTSGRQSP
jgi:hypothetical protein